MFKNLLARIAGVLEKAEIPYMVIGGQAVLIHGEPRLTKDIDITVGVNVDGFDKVRKMAETAGLNILPENPEAFVIETMVLPCMDPETGIRVDLTFSFSDYEKEAMENTVSIEMEGRNIRFINAENLVIHKIVASRPRDIEDVRAIILKNNRLDLEYIKSKLDLFSASLGMDYSEVLEALLNDLK